MNPALTYTATTTHSYPQVELWLLRNMGAWQEEWYRTPADFAQFLDTSVRPRDTYHFRTAEQATLFALRWA